MLLTVFLRTVFFYFFLLLIMRLSGKRELGEVSVFDFVVVILMSELAAIPIANPDLPLLVGVIPLLTIMGAELGIAFLSLKNARLRRIINGQPSVLVRNGYLFEQELRRNLYCLDDLLEALRMNNIFDLSQVEIAILETNGQLTVIPKAIHRPLSPADINLSVSPDAITRVVIKDGEVDEEALAEANHDRSWLNAELQKRQLTVKDVFYAHIKDKNLHVQPKQRRP